MPRELEILLAAAQGRNPAPDEQEAQRRSFAFGNTHFENERITKETVDRAAEELKARAIDASNRHPTR